MPWSVRYYINMKNDEPNIRSSTKTDATALGIIVLFLSTAAIWFTLSSEPPAMIKPVITAKHSEVVPIKQPSALSPTVPEITLQPLGTTVQCANNTTLNVVAHQDDDLLFLSPDLIHAIAAKNCIRSVYLTAGDAGLPYSYWHSREIAVEAAYAYMYGVPNVWHEDTTVIANHKVRVSMLEGQPSIGMIFMTLPDGHPSGKGFGLYKNESMRNLRNGTLLNIHTVDGAATYTKQELVTTLLAIMNFDKPNKINTQNPDNLADGDHSDHHAAGYFTRLARNSYAEKNTLRTYIGYPIAAKPINISSQKDVEMKRQAFVIYIEHDPKICPIITCGFSGSYQKYLQRQYGTVAPDSLYVDRK